MTGKVLDAATGSPLVAATIRLDGGAQAARVRGAVSDNDGRFSVRGLSSGTYRLLVSYVGYRSDVRNVEVAPGDSLHFEIRLQPATIGLDEVVVSASRRPEKITEAPASVSVVGAREIRQQPALTVVDHLRDVPGVDIVQSGLTQSNVVVRGFNNAFSGTLMTLTDNRMASVPSLRVNAYNFIPLVDDDIEQIEIIRGPGSALYGPNTANGVLNMITRSPLSSPGTWVSLTAGERNVLRVAARQSMTFGDRLGIKISGQFMRGDDWGYLDTAEVSSRQQAIAEGADPDTLLIGVRDSTIERVGGELRVDWAAADDLTAIVAIGLNDAIRNTDITGIGAAEVRDWRYTYYQARLLWGNLFAQVFLNQSYSGNDLASLSAPPSERGTYVLATGQPIVDNSSLLVAQLQHYVEFGTTERLTYGADYQLTTPRTEGTVSGVNENSDQFTQFGIYLQSETRLFDDRLHLVGAGRFDIHTELDAPIVSPRAAIVYNPAKDQSLRLTYNRAYTAPTSSELFLDILGRHTQLFDVRAASVPASGFTFRRGPDGRPLMRSYFAADPTAYLPLDSIGAVWGGIQKLVKSELAKAGLTDLGDLVDQIPAPPSSGPLAVGTELRSVNLATGAFDPVADASDRSQVGPTITNTFELGYRGVVAERISLTADVYNSRYEDFIGPLETITPSVFLDREGLQRYLSAALSNAGLDDTTAAGYAQLMAGSISGEPGNARSTGAPIGVVTPQETSYPDAVLLSYRNYGSITLWGVDLGLRAAITRSLSVDASASWVSRNFFENLDGVADLSLNAPKHKATIGLSYDDPEVGVNASSRVRYVDGFTVRSGVYSGRVPSYVVVDATAGVEIPWVAGLRLTLTAQNLLTWVHGGEGNPFEQRHQEFVGTPAIGRLVLLRLSWHGG